MEKAFDKIEALIQHAKEYIDNRFAAAKLNFAEKTSDIIARLIASIAVVFVLFFCVVFASIAFALVLSDWIGKMYAGFLIVALFYLLVGLIIWGAKEKLLRLPIMNAIIKKIFDKKDEEVS